jgi:hypothetical protein
MPQGNHFKFALLLSAIHGKNAATDYTHCIKDSPDATSGGVLGDVIVDQVLSQVKNPSHLKS